MKPLNQNEELGEIQKALGYGFSDVALLLSALTHPSFVAERKSAVDHNQRLEFLGDAVLQLSLTDILYRQYPMYNEGRLTRIRAAAANEMALARFARRFDIGRFLRLGKGEQETGGRDRNSTLADAFEAILGAVYLDGGLPPALTLCRHLVEYVLEDEMAVLAEENPKGALQELTQERMQVTPVYRLDSVSGPEHAPQFDISVFVDDQKLAEATAGSRKAAEKEAARLALNALCKAPLRSAPSGQAECAKTQTGMIQINKKDDVL